MSGGTSGLQALGKATGRTWSSEARQVCVVENSDNVTLTNLFIGMACHKGADIRIVQGTGKEPARWPRESFSASFWHWHDILSFRWASRGGPEHINVLEFRAALAVLRWRAKRPGFARSRFLHLMDSQVALAALARGRSSSRKLAALCEAVAAYLLSSGSSQFGGYINTSSNPADRPSRQLVRKRHLKR